MNEGEHQVIEYVGGVIVDDVGVSGNKGKQQVNVNAKVCFWYIVCNLPLSHYYVSCSYVLAHILSIMCHVYIVKLINLREKT